MNSILKGMKLGSCVDSRILQIKWWIRLTQEEERSDLDSASRSAWSQMEDLDLKDFVGYASIIFFQSPTKNSPKSAKIEPRIWLVDWLMLAIQYCQRMFQAVLKFQFLEHVPFFGEITLPPINSKRFLAVAPLFLSEYLIIIEPKSAAFETLTHFSTKSSS